MLRRRRRSTPSTMGRNGQILREGAEALGLTHHPLPATPALRRSAARARTAAASTRSARCTSRTCRARSPRGRGCAPASRSGAIVFEGERARSALELPQRASPRRARDGAGRPYTVRARRAVILAGGAFGTPELLLRSGFRSPSGELGRNLRIHPACWVGARFDDEVRGWDGVMQSYAVDEWQHRGRAARGDVHPARVRRRTGCPAPATSTRSGSLGYGNIASTGVHLSDRSRGRVGLGRDGSLRITYRLLREDARASSSSASPARRSSSTPPAPARSTRRSPAIKTTRRAGVAELEASPPSARAAPRGVPPDGHGADGRRPDARRHRDRRRRPRRRRPLRRRREPVPELDRGQPDDDHHRDGRAGRAGGSPTAR